MNYIGITKSSLVNGEGVRTVLWVSGCSHHCPGCQNPDSWNPEAGQHFGNDTLTELIDQISKPYIDGLTISGGDPMYYGHRLIIRNATRIIKLKTKKSIWMYTGYEFGQIKDDYALRYIDVVVDGRYEKDLPPAKWRGSNNQKIWRKERGVWKVDNDTASD